MKLQSLRRRPAIALSCAEGHRTDRADLFQRMGPVDLANLLIWQIFFTVDVCGLAFGQAHTAIETFVPINVQHFLPRVMTNLLYSG